MPNRLTCSWLLFASITLASCATTPKPDDSYQRFMQLAGDLQQRGDATSAAALYDKATQQPGAGLDAWLKLGEARLASGDARGAERAYQQALEKQPDSATALAGLGSSQLRQGKLERAVTALSQAAKASPQADTLNRLGIAQILRGHTDAAQAAFKQSLALAADNLDTQCNLALAYALGKQPQQALRSIQAVSASPRSLPRHQRNTLLVTVLAGQEQQLDALRRNGSLADITPAEFDSLLSEARRIKAIADPAAQANALGLIDSR